MKAYLTIDEYGIKVDENAPMPYISVKWPAMVVEGQNVSVDQARDIIFKTHGYYGCNDKSFEEFVLDSYEVVPNSFGHRWIGEEERNRLGFIPLSYVDNNNIATCWVGGLSGWVDWDGTIGSRNKNIGKWPSLEEVANDWYEVAKAFPYLSLKCYLLDRETCEEIEGKVTVLYVVENGTVKAYLPDDGYVPETVDPDFMSFFSNPSHISKSKFIEEFNKYKAQNNL